MGLKTGFKWGLLFIVSAIGIISIQNILLPTLGSTYLNASAKPLMDSGNSIENRGVNSSKRTVTKKTIINLPARIKIPKINVDASIKYMGLTTEGAMDTPKSPFDVGWFRLGKRPGENGSAVISGHYGKWKNGDIGVFTRLSELRKGDTISIEDNKGKSITFIVQEIRKYDPNGDTSKIFSSDDGKGHLNLITCQGVWNNILKSYPDRLVIFADKK